MTTKIKYFLEPRLTYVLKRQSSTEHTYLTEEVAVFDDLDLANRSAKALSEYDRRNPDDQTTVTELFTEFTKH